MKVSRSFWFFFLAFATLFLGARISAQSVQKEVIPYVQGVDMTYSIQVSTGSIEWDRDEEVLREILRTSLKDWADTHNAEALNRIYEVYDLLNYQKEGYELATDALDQIDPTVRPDLWLESAFRSGNDSFAERAWQFMAEWLQSETGSSEIPQRLFIVVIDRLMQLNQFELALFVADQYKQNYPESSEAWFSKSNVFMVYNMFNLVTQSVSTLLKDAEDAESLEFLKSLSELFSWEDIDKALKISPDNYRYLLGSLTFRSISAFWTSMVIEAQGTAEQKDSWNRELMEGENSFRSYGDQIIRRAKGQRPSKDIQIHLASALYYLVLKEFPQALREVNEALLLRPDLKEVYNARIAVQAYSLTDAPEIDEMAMGEYLEENLMAKEAAGLMEPGDYAVLFSYYVSRYKLAQEGQNPSDEYLSKAYVQVAKGLSLNESNLATRLSWAWSLALSGEYSKARKIFDESLPSLQEPELRSLFLFGRGVSSWFEKSSSLALLDVQLALKLNPSLERAKQFLEDRGVR